MFLPSLLGHADHILHRERLELRARKAVIADCVTEMYLHIARPPVIKLVYLPNQSWYSRY
jgi:hypothetical protein